MKKLLGIVVLAFFLSGNANAESIAEELTKLNNLYKEGAITKEEFSKAKSILLKIETQKAPEQEVKVEKKIKEKKKKKEIVEKENKINKENIDISGLTLSEEDALKAQIFGCWSVPFGLGYSDEDLLVRIKLKLRPDGSIIKTEIVDHERMHQPGQGHYKVLAESLLRAIQLCQPLSVPTTGYEKWKDLQLNFDAREILGG